MKKKPKNTGRKLRKKRKKNTGRALITLLLIIVIALTVFISGWVGYGLGGWRIWKKDVLR